MNIPPAIERIATMDQAELRRETERLRGVAAMTVYKGLLIPKGGLQKKEEEDSEEKKKKLMLVGLAILGAYFAYNNLL